MGEEHLQRIQSGLEEVKSILQTNSTQLNNLDKNVAVLAEKLEQTDEIAREAKTMAISNSDELSDRLTDCPAVRKVQMTNGGGNTTLHVVLTVFGLVSAVTFGTIGAVSTVYRLLITTR